MEFIWQFFHRFRKSPTLASSATFLSDKGILSFNWIIKMNCFHCKNNENIIDLWVYTVVVWLIKPYIFTACVMAINSLMGTKCTLYKLSMFKPVHLTVVYLRQAFKKISFVFNRTICLVHQINNPNHHFDAQTVELKI